MNDTDNPRTAASHGTSDFFKPGSVATLSGSAAAVVLVTNVLNNTFDRLGGWVPLVLAFVFAIAAYQFAMSKDEGDLRSSPRFARWVLVVLNGCLIYASAFGVQGTALSSPNDEGATVVEWGNLSKKAFLYRPRDPGRRLHDGPPRNP